MLDLGSRILSGKYRAIVDVESKILEYKNGNHTIRQVIVCMQVDKIKIMEIV